MTTNSISLLIVGLLMFGALVCIIVKTWRYYCNHFDEKCRLCNGLLSLNCKSVLVALLTISALVWGNALMAQDGTLAHPYPINNEGALVSLANCINQGQNFKYENDRFDIDPNGAIPAGGEGVYFQQTADIDMAGQGWVTIGNSAANGFRGIYLGNAKKISNLTLTANNPALFRYPNGTIQDLTMEDPVFSGTVNYGGALATFVMGGTIKNCHSIGKALEFNGKYCGALIGWVGIPNGNSAGEITISNCSNSCNITSYYQQENNDSLNVVAGVVACINAQHYQVTRCFNTGKIVSTYRPEYQNDVLCFAGVVGRGYLPAQPSEITYCFNTGNITAHCGYLGGVAGFFDEEAGYTNRTRCTIDYCFNTGDITGICATKLYGTDTIPSNYYSNQPMYADTNIDVFSLGGVVAPSKTKTRYCFNTGRITLTKHPHPKFSINGDQGVAGVGSIAEHCFNVGEIYNYEKKTGRAAGVCRDTANHCFNAAYVYDRNPKYNFTPHNIARLTYNSVSDMQMSVEGQDGNIYPTAKVIGEFSKARYILGEEHWIYELGRYPRLKWTDTCDWARDIAKVACTPIVLSNNNQDIRHVEAGIRLLGCDNGVVWKAPAGNCLFVNSTLAGETCNDNAIQPAVQSICNEPVTLAATLNGDTIKTVTLLRSVAATLDTIAINSLAELKALRDGINTGEAFFYGNRKLPRYAEGVTFKLTTDLDMQNEKPWIPIGSVFYGSRFAGTFLGQGHTISNLCLDDATIYFYRKSNVGGLFGMLSGEVSDLNFTNLSADSTSIVVGAVCALMNRGKIENCTVEGYIETSSVNNNYATCGIAGIAGASLTTHFQDDTLSCYDTIRNCINYANIITQVGRGTNLASYSAGGIIGHGGVVIDCANAGDIYGGDDCGYIGGIGGDLTTALRCFNTGRVSIEKKSQDLSYYVGGVVAVNPYPQTVRYCYNAGNVNGSDRDHTGGIMGMGDPEYCYTSNTVTSDGTYLGSIVGANVQALNHCYYDKQMSTEGGINGHDRTGQAEGRETNAMLGTALQGLLGNDTNWVFTTDLYPQLNFNENQNSQLSTLNSKFSTLSRTSVMPVVLGPNQTWASTHDSIPLRGCDDHYFWKKLQGSVTVDSCKVSIKAHDMGVIELAATFDSIPYRHIMLKYNLDADHALLIKNAKQFDNMRKVINNADGGYYRFSDSTFLLTLPANANPDDYIVIAGGGKERYFKLITDININVFDIEHGQGWIPIGGESENEGYCVEYKGMPFKGFFDGGGHTVRNLEFQMGYHGDQYSADGYCTNHQGLFGVIDGGTVQNLRIANSSFSMGNVSAFLCAVNKGTIRKCEIDSCTLTISNHVYGYDFIKHDQALFCANNDGGLIDSCRVKNSFITSDLTIGNNYNIGGLCGLNNQGTIKNCRVDNLFVKDLRSDDASGSLSAAGGVCGKNFHGQLLADSISNSLFLFRVQPKHQFIGGICGLNGYNGEESSEKQNEPNYAHIPSIISECVTISTRFNNDTCGQNSWGCQKQAYDFGAIVGRCQGSIVQVSGCSTYGNTVLEITGNNVGGICGQFIGEGTSSYISDCSNNATVTGHSYVGGIVGLLNNSSTINCQNQGNVWSVMDSSYIYSYRNPSGYYAGGIAGACVSQAIINGCQNYANVSADSSYVGGIVGALLDNCKIFTSSNNSPVATVSGINQVGGIIGLFGKDAWFGAENGEIGEIGCANSGKVKGIAQVGGLVGYAKESILSCSGNNNGTVQGSSMTGQVYGYAEDPAVFADCTDAGNYPSQNSPQWINNAAQFCSFRDAVNGGTTYEGQTFMLTNDIDLGNTNWIPIGTPEHPFRGTFDGAGHSVQFSVNAPNSDYQGLFGYMQGTVKNLYLKNCSVNGHDYVGGIAGYCHGTIESCGTLGSCEANAKVSGNKYVGGLVGMARYAEILDSYNGSNITGDQYVGGLVGDFVAYKNDDSYGESGGNSWGKSIYNIYGGNVSRCFNYGMVKATNNDSYVGGLVGSTSTEVKHSYNSGIVDGKDKVGGIAGLLDGDSIHHCYNVGSVSATGSNKAAICGIQNSEFKIQNCFYDRQMCMVKDANATDLYTNQMTGSALQTVLSTDFWSYNNNEYPQTKYWNNHPHVAVAVKPLLFPGHMPIDNIYQPFTGDIGNHITWMRYGTANPGRVDINTVNATVPYDNFTPQSCGADTVEVHYSYDGICEHRLLSLNITGTGMTVTIDTACMSYKWSVNDVTYTKSGIYTWPLDGCSGRNVLDLTIVGINVTVDQIEALCDTISDGTLMATATGGLGNGFTYHWKRNGSSQNLSNDNYATGLSAGSYYLLVTDAVKTTCHFGQNVTLNVQPSVALTIAACSENRHYDGTPLTGSRFIVTEEGHAPETVAADHFAILSNGDTLRVTLTSGSITDVDTLVNTVKISSYTIRNGIDHSCHYSIDTSGKGTLTVTPRPVMIVVDDASKEVGDPDPVFTGTVTGLVNADDLGTIRYFRTNNEDVRGNYPDVLFAEYDTASSSNYSVTVNPGDFLIDCRHLTTPITNWPETETTGINECFSVNNTAHFPSDAVIRTLIMDANNIVNPDFEIEHKDTALCGNTCDWRWARTFTISTSNSGYCDVETRVIYISGGDQTAPVHSDAWPWAYGIPYQNACLDSFNMDLYLPKDEDLFVDCSKLFITHTDVSWGDDRDGWTIRRSYVVSDSCGHTIYDTLYVSGSDRTPPKASNPKVKNNTLWADSVQCFCDSIHVINDLSEIKTLFGLSDECSGDDISLVSKTRTLNYGDQCSLTVIVAYVVADAYNNQATFYHAQFIQDTLGPTFTIVPFNDTTLCVDPDGNYEATINRIAALVSLADVSDNCTKLQGSFTVSNSINFDPSENDNDGYSFDNKTGIRTYSQVWSVTDSCGNTTREKLYINLYPLATIRIDSLGYQEIIYGQDIKDVWVHHQYSFVELDDQNSGVFLFLYPGDDTTGILRGAPDAAGTFDYILTATSSNYCNTVDTTVTILVNPRPITITAASATKKYDGTPLTSNNYTCTLTPPFTDINNRILVNNDSIASVTITGSQTNVGISENVPSNAAITIATETTADKNPSYAISYASGTLEVIPNDTLITVVPGSGTKVYDGTPLTKNGHFDFTVTGVPEGLTWTATADGMVTNVTPGAGEKTVNAVTSFHIFDADGVDVTAYFTNIHTDSTGTLTIAKKSLTITADNATKVYDGTALTKNSYTQTGLVAGETITSVTITGSQTIAGTSNNVPSAAVIKKTTGDTVTANYKITYENGTLTVMQKPLKITAGSDTIIYNGAWLYNNTYTHSALVAGDSLWSVTITGRTLYGESDNVPSDAVIKNAAGDTVTNSYNIDYVNGHLKIKQKELFIRSGDSSKVYDGTDLTCHTFTYSGLVQTDTIVTVVWGSALKNADTIDNLISLTAIHNRSINDTDVTNCYIIEPVYGKLMVEQKPLTITAASATKVYDGTALTKDSYTHSELVPGDSIWSVSIVGSQTTAGTSENVPSDAEIQNSTPDHVTDNYKITYVNGTLKVTPRPLTITADGATKEYDGTALTKDTYTHTALIAGDSIRSVKITGSQTLVGSSDNVPSEAVIMNDTNENVTASYAITYKNDTLRVTPNTNEIVVTPSGGSKEYDGTPLTKTEHDDFTVTGLLTGFIWTAAADGTVTNVVPGAGEKAVNEVSEFKIFNTVNEDVTNQFSNINTSAVDTLKITKKAVTLASGNKTREYNGLALTNDEVEGRNSNGLTVEDGWITGEGATYSFTGSQLYVGESTNTFICIPNNNTLVSNYNINKTEGTLKITANTTELKAVSADGTWTYDGKAHTKYEYTVTYGNESYPVTITAPATSGTATLSTGDVVTITPAASAKITHVAQGNVTNAFNMDVTHSDHYSNQTKSEGSLTITPTTLTVTTGSASREYDGTPLTATGSISGLVTLTGGSQETVTLTVTGSQTFVGNSTNTYSLTWNGTAVEGDYTISETLGTLTITPSAKEVKVVSAEGSWTYDGNVHTKYEYVVTYDTESYNVSINSGASTGTVALSTGDVVTITPAASAKITHVAENNVTNAFSFTVENSDQYSNKTKTEDILKLTPATLTITTGTDSKGYDGTPLTAAGSINGFATPTGGSQETATFAVTGSQTVVGNSQNSYSLVWDGTAVESDYTLIENIGTLTVGLNHLPIVITSGDHEFNYDGHAHSYPSYQVTYDGFQIDRLAGDSMKFLLPTGDMLSVNNAASITYYDASASHNNTFDYVIENADYYDAASHSSVFGTININPLSTPLQIASLGYTWTYDGNSHQYKHYTVQFAGAYISGNALVNDTVFALPTGDTLTITDAPSITDAGKLANTFSYTLQHDFQYMGIRDTVVDTLRVNPLTGIEVTVKEHGGITIYDGYEQRVTGYDLISINNSLYTSSDFHYSGIEEDSISKGRYVGNYPMNIMPADFANDNPNFADVLFIIEDSSLLIEPNPAVITITAGSSEKLYDGTPLVDSSYTYTPAGIFAQGDSLVVEISGMISGVGQVDNEVVDYKVYRNESFNGSMVHSGLRMASPAGYTKDVTDCYTFANEMVKGKLVIYEALTLTLDSISETLCMGRDEGFVKYRATGGKPATPRYNYQVEGTVTHDTYTGTFDSTFRISSLRPDTYEVTVTESLGYTITSSFVIDVREVITEANSSLTCPADIDTVIRHGGCHLELDLGTPVFSTTTSLPMSEITISNNAPADHLYPAGETVVTWVARSLCGDSITCEQKIKVSFSVCPDAVDYEGNHYPSVRLGSGCKCWTTENLKSIQYSDGRAIEDVMSYHSSQYPNISENVNIFGHLYTWYAAADTQRYGSVDSVERAYDLGHHIQGVCPEGWYLPTDEDFEELNIYPTNDLRSTSYWISGSANTNATGFNSLPGGMYNCTTSRFEDSMGASFYWSCHPVFDLASGALIDYVCDRIRNDNYSRCNGFSVRCVLKEP